MDLTPHLLHDAEFREARRGGYDTRDVDEFLERVAVGVAELQDRLRKAVERIDAAEARATAAERAAEESGGHSSEAAELDETLKRTLVLAQRTADAAIKEARDEAARTIADAREQADRLTAEARHHAETMKQEAEVDARRGADEARERALSEVAELNSTRDVLQRDVELLTGHVEDQRQRLRAAAESLQHVLDDPSGLVAVPRPEISDIAIEIIEHDDEPEPADELFGVDDRVDDHDDDDLPQHAPGEPTEAIDLVAAESRPVRPTEVRATEGAADLDPLAERDPGDEAYLAELRKAMTDESPLGPREEDGDDVVEHRSGDFDAGRGRRERSRFGRRS